MKCTNTAAQVNAYDFDLEEYIPCQLATLSTSIIRSVATLFEDWYDISIPEWKVLAIVVKRPGLSAVDVAQYAGLDTVAVSRAVTKLMDAGRITREFGKEDRRRSILSLSNEGREVYEQIMPVAVSLQSNLLEGLTRDEKVIFEKALSSLRTKSRELTAAFEAAQRPVRTRSRPAKPYHSNGKDNSMPTSLVARFISGYERPIVR
jgi:DNA-binding MarR family transcriptional regulator